MDNNAPLPEPLTPADCDVRGYDYMPLFGHRLFSSETYDQASDAEFRICVRLWWAAWQQCPAGSLPNSDTTLARLADLGRDVGAWRAVKEVALRGFILCSDGRLYHEFLSEAAVKAYELKLKNDKKRAGDQERLKRWREERKRRAEQVSDGATNASETPDETRFNGVAETPVDTVSETVTETPEKRVRKEEKGREEKLREESHNPQRTFEPRARTPLPGPMPTASDPPERWFSLADKTEVDDRNGIEHPVVGGHYLDVTCSRICEAASMPPWTPIDWTPVIQWLRDGINPDTVIIPAIRRVAARSGYAPPRFLTYFDRVVREGRAAA